MATVGTLAINIVSRHANAVAGMKKTGAEAKKMGGKFAGVTSSMGGMIAGFASAGAALGILNKAWGEFNKAVEQGVAAGDTAKKIGFDVQALQRFHFAAQQANIEVSTFNMAVQRMTRRVAEAAAGTGEAKDALKELGLDAKELNRIPLDQRLLRIADKLNGVKNQSDRVRLAMKLFDSEGVVMVNMLQDGSAALIDVANQAKNVMTEEEIQKLREYKDAVGRINDAWMGFVTDVAPMLAPIITGFVDKVLPVIERLLEALTKMQRLVAKTKGLAMAHPLFAAAAYIGDTMGGNKTGAPQTRQLNKLVDEQKKQTKATEDMAAAFGEFASDYEPGDEITVMVGAL